MIIYHFILNTFTGQIVHSQVSIADPIQDFGSDDDELCVALKRSI